ncbi:MAG TPA: hypothetical protein VJL80_12910 [Aeromicrobium sp.]|nr:hypothetical protein [Aeromicrobium sp.]HKY58933.1 hypothetical protein [Aeromicrobium sp.]
MSTPRDSPASRTADIVVAWVLYAVQLAGEAVLALVWLTSVMMTDSCGTGTDDPAVCNAAYFMTWWFAYAALLVVAVLATPIAILVAGHKGRRRWPWPALTIALLAAATAGYVFLFTR